MDSIDELLLYVQETNPEMTRKKLIEELSGNEYAAKSLIFTFLHSKGVAVKTTP